MYISGQVVPKDNKRAFDWFKLAAEQGDAFAQYNLAGMYANGWGVEQDNQKAIDWLKKAAKQGHVEAQNMLKKMDVSPGSTTGTASSNEGFQMTLKGNGMEAHSVIMGPILYKNGFMDFSSPMEFQGDILFFEHKYDNQSKSFGKGVKLNSGMTKIQVINTCKSSMVPVNKISDDEWRIGTGTILFRDGKLFAGTMMF